MFYSELKNEVLYCLSVLANYLSCLAAEVRADYWRDQEELQNILYSLEAGEKALEATDLSRQGDESSDAAWSVYT